MGYKRLDYLKGCKIQALWKVGYSQQKIADELGVHKSTISRELNRNITFVRTSLGYWDYKADYAQSFAEQRKKSKPKSIKFTEEIKEEWSPDQISGFGKRHALFNLSHEWIYQFILTNKLEITVLNMQIMSKFQLS